MAPRMRVTRAFRACIGFTRANAWSKLSSSSPGKSEELPAGAAESGRTIIDTGSDGCASGGGDGVVILSAAGFAGEGVLLTAAALTAAGFCGTGLPGGDEVSVVAGGDGAAGGLSSVRSSAGGAV